MIRFEDFKNNVDVQDKLHVNNTCVTKSLIFNGLTNKKKKHEKKFGDIPSLAATIVGINNTAAPLPTNSDFFNCWTDIDAQEMYLSEKPVSYLILSKPGIGAYSLGEAIAKKQNCVHLCPKNVIIDEMEQNSSAGKSLDFNMRHNNVIKYDVILSIMKRKLESLSIQHRGYVISGLPLVTASRKLHYLFYSLYSEEPIMVLEELLYDLIGNLKKKKPKKKVVEGSMQSISITSDNEQHLEEELEEEEEQEPEDIDEGEEELQPVELPKYILDSCTNIIDSKKPYLNTKQAVLLEQIDELLNLKIKPDIIIHVTCPDIDVITKKSHKYLNYSNNSITFDSFITKPDTEVRWPTKYVMSDYVSPHEIHTFNPKYNCKQPINFLENSIEQICNFKLHLSSVIDKLIKNYDPKFIIKVDGRFSIHQMMYHIVERLHLIPVKPVLIPEPLYLEEPPDDMEEFWNMVQELNVIRSGVINFNRYASPWFNRCPVELKNRKSSRGNPRYAVILFKHVYLLSSLNAMITFCRNPRPFLKLKYLEPTCRIVVIGTKSSGKTLISKCLSWIFEARIICYKTFLINEKQKKYDTFSKTILSEIIATIEDARFIKWQTIESERLLNLEAWYNLVKKKLSMYIPLLKTSLKEEKESASDLNFYNNFNTFRHQLSFLPILDDLEQCRHALLEKNLLQYAPLQLSTPTEKPSLPVLGDKDVTEAIESYIIANDLQKEIEPTPEELTNEMIKILINIDEESLNINGTYGKYIIDGFPSDPEYWGYLSDSKLLPDNTIALIENREIDQELIEQYAYNEKCAKNYEARFALASDVLFKTKLKTKKYSESSSFDVQIITNDLLNNVCDSVFAVEQEKVIDGTEVNPEADILASFTESVEKFREDWDTLKLRLEDSSKSFIEIELENKPDVELVDEMLLKLRRSYFIPCEPTEEEGVDEPEDEDDGFKDVLTYNIPQYLCETGTYCPIAFYDYGVLWEGKPEFCIKYDNKMHYFSKENCLEVFRQDVTKYQAYNNPYKNIPPLRICVIGCIGSGKTSLSKQIAKELGLLHVDFAEFINNYLIPKHFKKVGRRYENSFTDVPIDEEAVVEFQMDEENQNLVSDILSNETELRRLVYNYFEKGAPLLSILMEKLIKKLWFEKPFVTTGFVLDGYPKLPNDVEDMIASYCIPDLIVELQSTIEITVDRLSPKMFKIWKSQQNEAKYKARKKLEDEKKEWTNFITKTIVAKLIYDEIIDSIFATTEELPKVLSAASMIIDAHPSGSSNVDANLFNSYNKLIQEYPEPVDTTEWEKPDEVHERIDGRLEGIYEIDDESIQTFKEILEEQRIKTVSVDGTKSPNKVFRTVLAKLTMLRNRCQSFLEQTFIINYDIAELLLLEGFFFFSKFNRMCPVYIFENPNSVLNPYKVNKRQGKVFPVIHRCYIYFINGKDNVKKFRFNPLKYINNNSIKFYVEYPLRIGIIGQPKSGKSVLAGKLSKQFGLICISKGKAIRNTLENLYWTELASRMISALRLGEPIKTDLIIDAVQVLATDYRIVTHGFVFDGFPESPQEAMQLSKLGLYPLVVFDVMCNDTAVRNSQNEIYYDIIKWKPPYSIPFIENRLRCWNEQSYRIKNWIKDDYQNRYDINGDESKWQVVHCCRNYINEIVKRIHYYLNNVDSTIVSVDIMCISNEVFQQRMSGFKNMCPLCLCQNILKYSNYPVDRRGVVQFRNKFYWICEDHMNQVLKFPEAYLSESQDVIIPEIPAVVQCVNPTLVYENGVCIVTYAENLPCQKLERGSHKYAANFKGKTYLFCEEKCLNKFLATPHMYYDVTVFQETKIFPPISLKSLPHLGYLEQTVGNIMTEACCAVNVLRPKYPGLGIELSGLLFIGLYLKTHNSLMDKTVVPMYMKAYSTYESRCRLMIDVGLRLRSMDNPFAKYPKCCLVRNKVSGTARKSGYSKLSLDSVCEKEYSDI